MFPSVPRAPLHPRIPMIDPHPGLTARPARRGTAAVRVARTRQPRRGGVVARRFHGVFRVRQAGIPAPVITSFASTGNRPGAPVHRTRPRRPRNPARSRHDALDAQWPIQSLECLPPQLEVVAFSGVGGVRRHLALTPNAQHPGMHQIDTPAAIQGVQGSDDVVRFARPAKKAAIRGVSGAVASRSQRRHGPQPGFFSRAERPHSRVCPLAHTRAPNAGTSHLSVLTGHAHSQQKVDDMARSLNHRLHTGASRKCKFSCFNLPEFLGQCTLTTRRKRLAGVVFS